ncbi:MAG TPA: DegT/DnrJ/EryC1/StrS family aminotransferase [Candidatus Binatia bacterium]|nr:DegT/DnrJ/EryC1/StrS family aminotransferase [Candidatus Binatia bacterium]
MNVTPKVPFLDLVTPHMEMRDELVAVLDEALRTAGFVGGPMLEEFERDFAQACDTTYCVGVSSGTDALRFALTGAGVKPGDTVITVPNTFIATTEAISQAGAHFEFVDVNDQTFNMDPKRLEEFLETRCTLDRATGKLMSSKTGTPVTAVVPVHLYGQPAEMDAICDLAQRFRLMVIEDACQAHGAEYRSSKDNRWKKAGSIGEAAAFSFYPGKNLGALGEAGAITTNREDIARVARKLRQHGELRRYHHEREGYNGRLDSIQAGFLRAKLKHLPEWVNARRTAAKRYRELLAPLDVKLQLPYEPPWAKAAYHLYVVRTTERDALQKNLTEAGIGTGIHYPIPLHLQEAYRHLGYCEGDFPVAEAAAKEILSLPMYPQLVLEQQRQVAERLIQFFGRSTHSEVRSGMMTALL